MRRDYESLYALGVAFTAYAAAEAVGGSGFLAAFAAGLTVAALDVELCDCFLDYGEASAEMFLLLTFVAFGASLIWTGLEVIDGRGCSLFAGVRAGRAHHRAAAGALDRRRATDVTGWIIALFGPRGLSSLLLVLLPVFAGVAGSERLFAITCLVVLLSVVLHGGGIALYLRSGTEGRRRAAPAPPVAAERADVPSQHRRFRSDRAVEEKITIDEVKALMAAGAPLVLADVRTERSYREDELQATGAIRLPPDDAVRVAREMRLSQHATLVLYCA